MNTMRQLFIGITALAVVGLGLWGCYPAHGLAVEDFDTVITGYNSKVDFTPYRTFYMPDTIVHTDIETSTIITRKYDALILSTIAQNLTNLGYTRITDTIAVRPSVWVYLGATATSFETYYAGWGGYWGWYYPYYPPYWGGYPVYGTTSYDVGALAVDMVDRTLATSGDKGAIVWGGTISGLAGGGVSSSYLTGKLNQLFVQSPYLATGAAQ